MRKGRLPTGRSGKGQNDGEEGRESCTCNNRNFVSHVCRQCEQLICVFCRSGEHKHHESDKVNVVAGELRNDIEKNVSKQINSGISDSVLKVKQKIVTMTKDLITIEKKEIEKIDKQVNQLHKELDEIRTELVTRVKLIVGKDKEYLKDAEIDLEKTSLSIKSMIDAAKMMLEKANDIDIVKGGYAMCRSLNDISKTQVTMPLIRRVFIGQFVAGKCNRHDLQTMFGEIIDEKEGTVGGYAHPQHEVNSDTITAKTIKCVSRFSVSVADDGAIWGVCATADDQCWYCDHSSDDIKLLDGMGTRHRSTTVGVFCDGITRADDSSMYVTCGNGSLRKISTDHKVTILKTSLSFEPLGISHVPVTGEMLVCGGTDGVFSVTGRGAQRILTGVNFNYARDVAVNNNGDICVTDTNTVYIFNSNNVTFELTTDMKHR